MKHPIVTTSILLVLFLAIQLLGLFAVNNVMPVSTDEFGNVIVGVPDTAVGPPPEVTPLGGLLMILFGIGMGTVLILLLVRFRAVKIWKLWFMLAAAIAMTVSIGAIFGSKWYFVGTIVAFILAIGKVFYVNPILHNITEMLIYPGIAVLFYDILTLPVMFILLALISIYDIIAVFKSKHMQSMAVFQTQSNMFAGLAVPREISLKKTASSLAVPFTKPLKKKAPVKEKGQMAILGGGDVIFPLLFACVVMKGLVLQGITQSSALLLTSIIAITTTLALGLLFYYAQKGKFYPAMPAASAGAIIGWIIILIL